MVHVLLSNIGKRYGDYWAVRGINIEVKEGEFFVLLGPSGCGKTTLLKIIAGLLVPDEGKVFFNNVDVTYVPPWERNVGFVSQSPALFSHMTVWENVTLPLETRGISLEEIKRRATEILKRLEIFELRDRYPRELSGGQRQRVAIARAIIGNPRILLLDEPFANLDAIIRDKLRWMIKEIQEEIGVTTIFVTHDQLEAFQLADRLAVMNIGKVEQVGRHIEIYNHPKTPFVAKFIGANILKAKIIRLEGKSVILRLITSYGDSENGKIISIDRDAVDIRENISAGDTVLLAFRPEDVILVDDGKIENSKLTAKVVTYGHQKNFWRVILDVEGEKIEAMVTNHKDNLESFRNLHAVKLKISKAFLYPSQK